MRFSARTRAEQFEPDQHRDDREGDRHRRVQEDAADPADLRDGDERGVGQARRAPVRVLLGRA